MQSGSELRNKLKSIDHRGYPAYKELKGQYDFKEYVLSIDHVQGDPFAAPSRLSVLVKAEKAGFPASFFDTHAKRISNRLGLSQETDPLKIEQDLIHIFPKEYLKDINHLF